MISLIAAMAHHRVIGFHNQLPWHLPADLRHFKQLTLHKPVIMGRKTFESIGRPLPKRRNIVITRDVSYKKEGVEVVHTLAQALDLFPDQNEEVFIIGGAEIYKQTMPIADKLYITHVGAEDKDADAFFPEIIPIVWNEISHEEHEADQANPIPYTFSVYERII